MRRGRHLFAVGVLVTQTKHMVSLWLATGCGGVDEHCRFHRCSAVASEFSFIVSVCELAQARKSKPHRV